MLIGQQGRGSDFSIYISNGDDVKIHCRTDRNELTMKVLVRAEGEKRVR